MFPPEFRLRRRVTSPRRAGVARHGIGLRAWRRRWRVKSRAYSASAGSRCIFSPSRRTGRAARLLTLGTVRPLAVAMADRFRFSMCRRMNSRRSSGAAASRIAQSRRSASRAATSAATAGAGGNSPVRVSTTPRRARPRRRSFCATPTQIPIRKLRRAHRSRSSLIPREEAQEHLLAKTRVGLRHSPHAAGRPATPAATNAATRGQRRVARRPAARRQEQHPDLGVSDL